MRVQFSCLCSVALLAGCYDVTLKDYKGGNRDSSASVGTEVNRDRASAEDAIEVSPDSFDYRADASADASEDGPETEATPDGEPDAEPDMGPDMEPDLVPDAEPDLRPDLPLRPDVNSIVGRDLVSEMRMRPDVPPVLDIGPDLADAFLTAGGVLSLDFGSVVVGESSTVLSFTLTNAGQRESFPLAVSASTSEFAIQSTNIDDCYWSVKTLKPGESCTVRVVFTPVASGSRDGTITFSPGPSSSSGTISVIGTGLSPANLIPNTSGLSFGSVPIGTSSVVQSFTIINKGEDTSGVIWLTSTNSEFVIQSGSANDCMSGVTTLAPGASCTVRVVFTPSAIGSSSGTITFSQGPSSSSGAISVIGTGLSPAILTSGSTSILSFGSVPIGTPSAIQGFTIANTGQDTSGVIWLTSTNSDFVIQTGSANDCISGVTTLAPGASCTVRVVFIPSTSGSYGGTITFSPASAGAGAISVNGTGLLPAFLTAGNTSSLSFGPVPVGTSSAVQEFTITNTGQSTSGVISAASSSSEFAIESGSAGDCGSIVPTLAPGASCTVRVVFSPSANGNRSGTVTFSATQGGNGSVSLSGTGICPNDTLADGTGNCVPIAGAAWTQRASSRSWRSVASSSDGSKLVAVANYGYVYTSADYGASWTQRGSQQNWTSVASSSDGANLVAVAGGYTYTSTNSGATWTQGGLQQDWASVASSSDGTKLVAVAYGGYIYTSANSGTTWTPRGSSQSWQSVASSSDGTKLVAVASGNYIYTSADSGVTWTPQGAPMLSWQSVASSSDGTKLVAVAYYEGKIYTSTDSGVTWTPQGAP